MDDRGSGAPSPSFRLRRSRIGLKRVNSSGAHAQRQPGARRAQPRQIGAACGRGHAVQDLGPGQGDPLGEPHVGQDSLIVRPHVRLVVRPRQGAAGRIAHQMGARPAEGVWRRHELDARPGIALQQALRFTHGLDKALAVPAASEAQQTEQHVGPQRQGAGGVAGGARGTHPCRIAVASPGHRAEPIGDRPCRAGSPEGRLSILVTLCNYASYETSRMRAG